MKPNRAQRNKATLQAMMREWHYGMERTRRKRRVQAEKAVAAGVPFTLACVECDAGMDVETLEQADAAGWRHIQLDLGGLTANFLGYCPECI